MSCNIERYLDGTIKQVYNDNGEISQIYNEARDKFGAEKALELFHISQSNSFREVLGDNVNDLKVVTRFLAAQNKNKAPLTEANKADYININLSIPDLDINKLSDVFYDEYGMFKIDQNKLRKSGYYNEYEIAKLSADIKLQQTVKDSIEALKNTEVTDLPTILETDNNNLQTTTEINSFGKMSVVNPYEVQQEIEQALGDTTEEVFEQAVADLSYKVNVTEQEMQQYVTAKELYEENGEIRDRKNTETETTITQTAKVVSQATINKVLDILNIDDNILYNTSATQRVLKEIEEDLAKDSIDVIGLSDRPINRIFMSRLLDFLIEPSKQNTKEFADAYDSHFDVDLSPKETKIKAEKINADYIKLSTNKSEEELYKSMGLIKADKDLYIQTSKQDLEELYSVMETYPEKTENKPPKEFVEESIKKQEGFKNADIAEAVILYKAFYNVKEKEIEPIKNTAGFRGDYEYLTEQFEADFYSEYLQEKLKNSDRFKNFYSKFAINEKGIYLKSSDEVTLAQVKEYADEDLKQYSIISKQLPNLNVDTVETNIRDNVVNNPDIVDKFQGQFYKVNDNEILTNNETNQFIKAGSDIFENVDNNGNLNLYSKLEVNKSKYQAVGTEKPTTTTNLNDYLHLNQTADKFTKVKQSLSAAEKAKIEKDNFDCN
jgi:hypothetical protein